MRRVRLLSSLPVVTSLAAAMAGALAATGADVGPPGPALPPGASSCCRALQDGPVAVGPTSLRLDVLTAGGWVLSVAALAVGPPRLAAVTSSQPRD